MGKSKELFEDMRNKFDAENRNEMEINNSVNNETNLLTEEGNIYFINNYSETVTIGSVYLE